MILSVPDEGYSRNVSCALKQFHQYQQNEHLLSPQIIVHKNTMIYIYGNPGPSLGQAQKSVCQATPDFELFLIFS